PAPDDARITGKTITDLLGGQSTTLYNTLNLPTEFRAVAAAGSGHVDQVTRFTYDGGTLSSGNLTQVVAAYGTPSEQTAGAEYTNSLYPDLPTAVIDSLGRRSTATYFRDGSLATATSPQNLVAPLGDPDRGASTVQVEQDADELPWRLADALGHQTTVTYNAEAPGSS